jgi:hypothetical protein
MMKRLFTAALVMIVLGMGYASIGQRIWDDHGHNLRSASLQRRGKHRPYRRLPRPRRRRHRRAHSSAATNRRQH